MTPDRKHIAFLTREYPPEVYGGAGTHVEYLVRELRKLLDVTVHAWGSPRGEPGVESYKPWEGLGEPMPEAAALRAMSIDLAMAAKAKGSDLAHSHTWYANLGGDLGSVRAAGGYDELVLRVELQGGREQ